VIPAIPACLWLAETAEFAKKTHHIKTMIKNILSTAILAAAGVALSASSAMAQNPNYAPGDIVLFFQQFGGSNTVALNVGAATTFRDTTSNILNIANIGAQLSNGTTGFGASWYDSTSLWWGAAGVFNNSTSSSTVTNGDPGRTLYVSRNRNLVGTEGTASSTPWSVGSNTDMTTVANGIIGQNNRMETQSVTAILVEPTSTSNIDQQNLFNISGTPTNSFSVLASGGVQGDFGAGSFGSFGGLTAEGALDLYRILAVNPSGTVETGTVRAGQFQGTFVIEQDGDLSYIVTPVPEPATMVAGLALGAVATLTRRRRRGQTAANAA
jgi:hypothetical protein